jgi:hypothetical protein
VRKSQKPEARNQKKDQSQSQEQYGLAFDFLLASGFRLLPSPFLLASGFWLLALSPLASRPSSLVLWIRLPTPLFFPAKRCQRAEADGKIRQLIES